MVPRTAVRLCMKWVPKQLTDQHKLNRVEARQEFLRRYGTYSTERGGKEADEGVGGKLLRERHQNINTPVHHLHSEE